MKSFVPGILAYLNFISCTNGPEGDHLAAVDPDKGILYTIE